MGHRLLVVPTGQGVGLTSVVLGIVRALQRLGVPVAFYKPLASSSDDRTVALVRETTSLKPPDPMLPAELERLLGEGDDARVLEAVVAGAESLVADVTVIEGLVKVDGTDYAARLNVAMAHALDAELVWVAAAKPGESAAKVADNIDIAARAYGVHDERCCILNRVSGFSTEAQLAELTAALQHENFHPLGIIPYRDELTHPRVKELVTELGAEVLEQGDWDRRRIRKIVLCASWVRHAHKAFDHGALIITPGDRDDIVLAASLASLRGTQLAGLLLTGGRRPDPGVLGLCRQAFDAGLPLLSVASDSFTTATRVHDMSPQVPSDDRQRAQLVMDTVAGYLDAQWLKRLAASTRTPRMTTPAFRHQLVELARAANRIIVLPEGDEPRTVEAASICAARGLAQPVLLGDPLAIQRVAQQRGVELTGVRVVDPRAEIDKYVAPMVALRQHKGLNEAMARDQLEDTVVLGTMMLKQGDVHGLVSGAVHTTANTIRPALQLIRTAPGSSLVSSVFFMCLPEQVLVYGDCAVNPNPNAEQLAEIALQSAASASALGIEPRVAMISYSTGVSGAGADVAKVARATELARAQKPDLCIDGPLQYDAAAIADVARSKAPDSPVAGRATVFIFPDLNTGNTTYKAVQRSANVVSMGPMLQGLAKPVNDLSRGALVEDIVFTIALTAIQAAAIEKLSVSSVS